MPSQSGHSCGAVGNCWAVDDVWRQWHHALRGQASAAFARRLTRTLGQTQMKPLSHFNASLMSDSKWQKLFRIVATFEPTISSATWKLVGEAEPLQGYLPTEDSIWQSAVDDCLNGPVPYVQIEWIEIPSQVRCRAYENGPWLFREQDLTSLMRALESEGQFPIEKTLAGLRIQGYAWKLA